MVSLQSDYARQPGVSPGQVEDLLLVHRKLPAPERRSPDELRAFLTENEVAISKAAEGLATSERANFRTYAEIFARNGAKDVQAVIDLSLGVIESNRIQRIKREEDIRVLSFPPPPPSSLHLGAPAEENPPSNSKAA